MSRDYRYVMIVYICSVVVAIGLAILSFVNGIPILGTLSLICFCLALGATATLKSEHEKTQEHNEDVVEQEKQIKSLYKK
ncbi:unnamed protein product [marine sediment metagenome]|uniref:Uncharacterized protein n=1 Tax=marine sediment metagenome TaxID=412755 RepID=X0VHL5_9ZZZZ